MRNGVSNWIGEGNVSLVDGGHSGHEKLKEERQYALDSNRDEIPRQQLVLHRKMTVCRSTEIARVSVN